MKCYFQFKETDEKGNRMRCQKECYKDSYWCSKTHQIAYQEETYGGSGEHKPKKSIEEMQKRILAMKRGRSAI